MAVDALYGYTFGDTAEHGQRAIVESGGPEQLVSSILNNPLASVDLRAVVNSIFQNLACSEEYQKRLAAAGAAPAMLNFFCMWDINKKQRGTAVGALGNLLPHSQVCASA